MFYQVKDFNNFTIQAVDGELGRFKDILFDDRNWVSRYVMVDTNKWLPGGRKVLVSPISVLDPEIEDKKVPINLSKKDIENSPHLDEHKPVSREYETNFFDHFGYGYYWMGQSLWGPYPTPTDLAGALADKNATSDVGAFETKEGHLRSANELDGYQIRTRDGKIGRVADFILNGTNWSVPYLVIDSNFWMPFGKKVLVPTKYLDTVSWVDRTVDVEMSTSQIAASPEYNFVELQKLKYREAVNSYYNFLHGENNRESA